MTDPVAASLARFFETSPAAARATRPLARDARVALDLPGGPARFSMRSGKCAVEEGAEPDPDFTLRMPEAAVRQITALEGDDVGKFGIEFFKLVLASEPERKVRIQV